MKNDMVESHASLLGLKFCTFNLGDNRPILEPVFGVEGRSTTVFTINLFPTGFSRNEINSTWLVIEEDH